MFCQRNLKTVLLTTLAFLPRTLAEDAAIRTPADLPRAPYRFTSSEERLLDEVQHAAFLFFWKEVGTPSGLVKDRYLAPVSSCAAVGFQLSTLPVGVERGWISREQGAVRARAILSALLNRADNKHGGMYIHFPNLDTGGLSTEGYEVLASTVDTALLIAGAMPVATYFGGEVNTLVDRLIAEADWRSYTLTPEGFLSMGWTPDDPKNMAGAGSLHGAPWHLANDEERLIYFLAAGAPIAAHAVDPAVYYRLERHVERHADFPPHVVSYPGALFTHFFSHCWIDYRKLGVDDPGRFGVDAIRVDWFENSRRAALTHRARCVEMAGRFKSFAPDRWGLSACAARDGYLVPHVQPNLSDKDEWGEGTIAPYAAASAVMFTPRESLAAIEAFRKLAGPDGRPFVWREPAGGGYGFADSFNLDQNYASDDYVGIDHGPMVLAIENARSGLIWSLFMKHPAAQRSIERLGMKR